jgi:LPS-assembly protein
MKRFEVEGRAIYDRIQLSLMYGQYAPQPQLGFLTWRQGMLGSAQIKIGANWVLTTGITYDVDAAKISTTQLGLGYIDDCFIFAVNYFTGWSYSTVPTVPPVFDHRFALTIALRTIGTTGTAQTLSSLGMQ